MRRNRVRERRDNMQNARPLYSHWLIQFQDILHLLSNVSRWEVNENMSWISDAGLSLSSSELSNTLLHIDDDGAEWQVTATQISGSTVFVSSGSGCRVNDGSVRDVFVCLWGNPEIQFELLLSSVAEELYCMLSFNSVEPCLVHPLTDDCSSVFGACHFCAWCAKMQRM